MSLQVILVILVISVVGAFVKARPTPTAYVPPTDNETFPYENVEGTRFCFLDVNTTCYCCTWLKYTDDLAIRALGAIIGGGVAWLVLLIFICTCCWSTSLQGNF